MQNELRQSQEILAQAQCIAHVGNYTWDLVTNEIRSSNETMRIYGLPVNTVLSYDTMMAMIHPRDRTRVMEAIARSLNEPDVVHDTEIRVIRSDGNIRMVHLHGSTHYDEFGQPVQMFGTVQDITDRKRTEEALRKSEKLAVAGELAAGMAHEIRNPLTTLKGFLDLIRTIESEEKREEYYRIMDGSIKQIELISGEMLALAKPQVKCLAERDVTDILRTVVQLLNAEAILHDVEIHIEAPYRPIKIICDENQIKQVFVNITKNAIESMPSGGRLTITMGEQDQLVTITFTDTGCGISNDRIRKLGEPFYTTKEKGTGLGLMVSNKILADHHGHMSFESEVGKGTKVTVTLPIVSAESKGA
ncbi:PAS domain-containing sensor histidine kinase [Alicyclobacillus dauci]|uniref:histidine kinase n=1 Tax=Alicyclobacillus dauci TaxID=1475485 RepID=A0ABY6Z0V6_9BACL|nr:PAS domain-containing sensor histidine kinase [Alicyclobacillus dauci]WAH36223.1 ATP-binding protein [Alicyclobacillus dauci]